MFLTVLPEWQADHWWVRVWDFPRVQLAVLLVVFSALLLWAGRARGAAIWFAVMAALAALAWQLLHFAPYTPIVAKDVASVDECSRGRSLSILNINVYQENRNYEALLELVEREDPDVLLLLETDSRWARAVAPLRADYPHLIAQPLPNTYGIMLFSKWPMSGEVLYRVEPRVPSISARLSLPAGERIDFHAVHPKPPLPGSETGERDVELVLVGRQVRRDGRAAIVVGDLNDVGWSDTSQLFRRLSGMLDPRIGRGLYPTYHADYFVARWPLDHLFATEHFRLMTIDRHDDIGSDHFPISYRVCLVSESGTRLVPAEPPPQVEQEAAEEVSQKSAGDQRE